MRTKAKSRTAGLRFARAIEQLESRLPLAGLVSAAISQRGDLLIEGDEQDNQISVVLEGEQVVVSSLDAGTEVNGQAEARFEITSLTGSLRVSLAQGDDVLRVGGESHDEPHISETNVAGDEHDDDHDEEPRLSIPGGIFIKTGSGSDSVRVSFVETQGDLSINTTNDDVAGEDVDTINIGRGPGFEDEDHDEHDEHVVAVPSTIVMAEDTDCEDEGGPPPDVIVDGNTRIMSGDGADLMRIAFAKLKGDLRVQTGAGEDFFVTGRGPIRGKHGGGGDGGCGSDHTDSDHTCSGHTSTSLMPSTHNGRPVDVRVGQRADIDVGPHDDFAMLRNIKVKGRLVVSATNGDDAIGAQNLKVVDRTVIRTGAGSDTVALWQSHFANDLEIITGSKQDSVTLDAVQVARAFSVEMSSSDDTLVIVNSLFQDVTELNGGPGQDHLAISECTFAEPVVERFWELNDPGIIDEVLQSARELFGPFLQGH